MRSTPDASRRWENSPSTKPGAIQVPDSAAPGSVYKNTASADSQGNRRTAYATFVIPDSGYTTLTKTVEKATVTLNGGTAENEWTLRLTSHDPNVSTFTDVVDILPHHRDGRGTAFTGDTTLRGPVQEPPGTAVFYTTAAVDTLHEDPAHRSNGDIGEPSAIWSPTFSADATAIRVISKDLKYRDVVEVTVPVMLADAEEGDTYVNTAVARASSTALRMRASALFTVAVTPSLSWEKIGTASSKDFLPGSAWSLVRVSGPGVDPAADAVAFDVADCVADWARECTGEDNDPLAGRLTVASLEPGWYRLTETSAPDRYALNRDPHYIKVDARTALAGPVVNVPISDAPGTGTTPDADTGPPTGALAATGWDGVAAFSAVAGLLLVTGYALRVSRRRHR